MRHLLRSTFRTQPLNCSSSRSTRYRWRSLGNVAGEEGKQTDRPTVGAQDALDCTACSGSVSDMGSPTKRLLWSPASLLSCWLDMGILTNRVAPTRDATGAIGMERLGRRFRDLFTTSSRRRGNNPPSSIPGNPRLLITGADAPPLVDSSALLQVVASLKTICLWPRLRGLSFAEEEEIFMKHRLLRWANN